LGKLLLTLIIGATVLTSLGRPWIGICSYYLLSILGPQYIWWWNFEGLRVSFLVAIFTLSGMAFQLLKKNYDAGFLLNRHSLWLAVLWLCVVISYFFGPYVDSFNSSGLRPEQLFSLTNTIFIFYFCATLEINELRKLRYLVIVFAASTIYLAYWANNQYFTQNWNQFNMGRLMGPQSIDGGSIYGDENNFAMLFVTGLPFIFYIGWELQKKWQRYLLWAIIPMGWHAVFLTGSRGGLLGLVVTVFLTLFLFGRKFIAVPLIVLFIVFYQLQAGDVMKHRSDTIVDYEGENSAETRIIAWKGGLRMMAAHPFVGVGLGSFVTALPQFIESKPKVAHNTFIQFAAESGLAAGMAYIVIVTMFFMNSRKIRTWCNENENSQDKILIDSYNNASTVSFAGLIICSLFLSLNNYEIFFVLLIFNNALLQICLRETDVTVNP